LYSQFIYSSQRSRDAGSQKSPPSDDRKPKRIRSAPATTAASVASDVGDEDDNGLDYFDPEGEEEVDSESEVESPPPEPPVGRVTRSKSKRGRGAHPTRAVYAKVKKRGVGRPKLYHHDDVEAPIQNVFQSAEGVRREFDDPAELLSHQDITGKFHLYSSTELLFSSYFYF
jgi:hypothetical protein